MHHITILVLLFVASLPAQILRFANDSSAVFEGTVRCNIDETPPHLAGKTSRCTYVVGRWTGIDTRHIDVQVGLSPGERLSIDLATAEPTEFLPGTFPPAPLGLCGADVTIGGVRLRHVEPIVESGAGYDAHLRVRIGPMLVVEVFLSWWPSQSWCVGEAIVCASNPKVQDVVGTIPADFALRMGDATVLIPGLPANAPLMVAGTTLADGQCRIVPFVFVQRGAALGSAQAISNQLVQCRGIHKLHLRGNPTLPPGFDVVAWTAAFRPTCTRVLHSFENSGLDPAVDSGATGAQGSQSFVAGPAIADAAAIGPLYLAAIHQCWPLHHLEADGSQLDWRGHPGLRMNRGRVNRPISTDNLGKNNEPSGSDRHGHSGPEWEHDFDWTLWAADRLTGSAATEWLLSAHARLRLFSSPRSDAPGNWLPPSRGVGWWCFKGAELFLNLQDRALAEAVAQQYRDVFAQLISPQMGTADGWWTWLTDPRIGASADDPRAIVWQTDVLALGMVHAADAFEHWDSRALSQFIADDIMQRAWTFRESDGRWHVRDIIAKDGRDLGYWDAYYPHFGVPMGPAAMILWNPTHGIAVNAWRQILEDCKTWPQAAWLAPGVNPQ